MKTTAPAATIPLFDLKPSYAQARQAVLEAVARVLDSGSYILGAEVESFESEFAAAVGTAFCAGLSSGTQALQVALEAAGVGPGDEVIVPASTFIATASAASALGARPVFADVDPTSLTLDPADAARRVSSRTRAIVPVHLYGYPADMDPLLALARGRGIRVIEDAAQSHGALYKGRPAGSLGDAGCFSFYPTKNLGAAGDAGAITTGDAGLREACLVLRNIGRKAGERYTHQRVGQNFRLDAIQAAVLRAKLPYLAGWVEERRRLAGLYRRTLEGLPLTLPPDSEQRRHAYHLFVVRTPRRDALARHLSAAGIRTDVYYPLPLHLQPAYAALGHRRGELPVSERAAGEVLALPLYPGLADSDLDRVASETRRFFSRG